MDKKLSPAELTPYLRQFKHTDGSGFVLAYDKEGIDRLFFGTDVCALTKRIMELEEELARKDTQLGQLLDHCDDGECHECGKIICPHGDPMHFHHDGCPSCCQAECQEAADVLRSIAVAGSR